MSEPLDLPSPLAARLFAAERIRADASSEQSARILARVGATVGVAALGASVAGAAAVTAVHASRAAKLGLTAKAAPWIALAFAAGGGTGAAVHAIAVHPAPLSPPTPVSAPAPVPTAPDAPAAPVSVPLDAPAAPLSSRLPDAPSAPAPSTPSADGALAAERAVIDRARTALTRGQPASALDALDDHAKTYPRGRLVEEREALAIQALSALHRAAEARQRATTFRRAHPQSVFLPAIELAVGPEKENDAGP